MELKANSLQGRIATYIRAAQGEGLEVYGFRVGKGGEVYVYTQPITAGTVCQTEPKEVGVAKWPGHGAYSGSVKGVI